VAQDAGCGDGIPCWFYSGLVFFTASLIYGALTAAGLAIFLTIVFLLY